jgi:hypothetical protein
MSSAAFRYIRQEIGALVTDFDLTTIDGGRASLTMVLNGKKADAAVH